jgi:hypothetical protein
MPTPRKPKRPCAHCGGRWGMAGAAHPETPPERLAWCYPCRRRAYDRERKSAAKRRAA